MALIAYQCWSLPIEILYWSALIMLINCPKYKCSPGVARYTCYRNSIYLYGVRSPIYNLIKWIAWYKYVSVIDGPPVTAIPGISRTDWWKYEISHSIPCIVLWPKISWFWNILDYMIKIVSHSMTFVTRLCDSCQ